MINPTGGNEIHGGVSGKNILSERTHLWPTLRDKDRFLKIFIILDTHLTMRPTEPADVRTQSTAHAGPGCTPHHQCRRAS